MGFRKIEKNTINYQPPTNDSLRLVSGNTALVTVVQQVVPLSGITNIGSGPGYIYKQTQNQIAEMMGISGDTNISIAYNSTGDTVGVHLNDNIIVNSISASTIYSGSTDLSLLIGGGGSFTQQYVSGSTGSQSLISISPAGTGNIAQQNSIVLSKNSSGLSTYSTIIGGSNNLINSGADYSLISGKNNTISQPYAGGTFSHILGANNKSNGSYINIIGNYNSGYTSNSSIIGKSNLNQGTYFGAYQLIYSTYGLNNIAGSRNQIINAGLSNINNGFNNIIQNTNYSSILNGNRNRIKFSQSSIVQGNYNKAYSNSYSIIFGNNNIIATANTSYKSFNIIFGNTNSITDATTSSIFGGQLNGITGSTILTTGMNAIIQGDGSKIHGSRSTVINGFNNWILDNSQDSTIISGQDNNLIGGQNSIIFNGRLNNINYSTGVTLINVSNITTTSADTNLLITNKIKSIALTGATTQMVVADSSGLLSVQAIPSGGSSTQQYVSGSTGSNSLISITPGPLGSVAQGNNAIALGYYNSANTLSSAIIGGEYNLITGQGKTSGILAGKLNIIHSSYSSPNANNIIIGGQRNKISGSTVNSKITSSYNSNLYSAKYSSIENSNYSTIRPYGNYSTQSSHCLIMNASYSTASGFFSNVFGGTNSVVSGTSNVVINGNQNEVRGGQNSTILNGISNELNYSSFSMINTGFHNHINSSNYSTIIGGKYNTLTNVNYSTIINSRNSKLNSSASGSTIIGLRSFTGTSANTVYVDRLQARSLTGATTRMVVANSNGLLSTQSVPAQLWTVGGVASSVVLNNGYTTANSDYTLVAGKQNTININSAYSVILGGIGNQIENNSQKSAIVGGMENYIRDYGTYSFIGAGRGGYIVNSKHSFIGSGYRGRIYNNSSTYESKYNSILNGYNNNLNRGINCTIIGSYNLIGNGDLLKYSLVHGKSSKVYSNYGVILGGYSLTLNDDRTTLVDNLQIATAPLTDNSYLLNINPSNRKVGRTTLSGGSGIQITTAGGNLTVTYTGATSSVNTTINNGINTFTAGTSTFQSVNITGASLNNLTVTGSTSITTLSASTIYSGSTDLSTLFEPRQTNYRQTLLTNYVYTSSTAVANFSFDVLAGEVYEAKMYSTFKVNNTGGMKLTLSGNALWNGFIQGNTNSVLSVAFRPLSSSGNTTNLGTAANTTFQYYLSSIISAATNTTIALGFSPQTNGQQITVFSGSTMTLHKI